MRFLFIVQGEGRGHLTQALTLEDMFPALGVWLTGYSEAAPRSGKKKKKKKKILA